MINSGFLLNKPHAITPGSPSPAAAVRLKINGRIMLDVPAKPDMGLIIRRRAGQLTLSRESRNKPEEKQRPGDTHSWDYWRLQQTAQMSQWTPFAESQFHSELIVWKVFWLYALYWFDSSLIRSVKRFFLLFVMHWFWSNISFPPVSQYFILSIVVLMPPWLFCGAWWGCRSEQSWSHPFFVVKT